MSLSERVALVTGAAQGIGEAIALKLAEKGAHVAVSDIDEAGAIRVAKAVRSTKQRGLAIQADVSDRDHVARMIESTIAEFGKLEILVNNAGIAHSATLLKLSSDAWDQVLAVNLKGVFNVTQAVAPHMIQAHYGKIVNISSIYGRTGTVGDSNYAASKAGIIGFTKSIAQELARHNINVNAILPGMVDTPLLRGIPEKYLKPMREEIPLRRVATPEDIANVTAFLASEEASYITGAAIEVTGGWRM
jgi:3-oxoacyl-[acyl-carrier protein] reductase